MCIHSPRSRRDGVIAGALVPLSVELLELRLSLDDPGGAVPSHAIAGLWGIVAAGLFSNDAFLRPLAARGANSSGQILAQIVGIATLIGFVLPLTYALNFALDRIFPQRADPEGEQFGLDLHELGAGAYPELMTHTEDFRLR